MKTELRLPALTELLVQRCEGCWVEVLLEAAAAAFPAVRQIRVQQLSAGRLTAQETQEFSEHIRLQAGRLQAVAAEAEAEAAAGEARATGACL